MSIGTRPPSRSELPHTPRACPASDSLSHRRPDLAEQWHPTLNGTLKPYQVHARSNKKVWWQCADGHEWEAVVGNRARSLVAGCPVDRSRIVIAGLNDLASRRPDLAEQWHPTLNGDLLPSQIAAGSNRKVWWKCSDGHEWSATPNGRRRTGCPFTAGVRVQAGFNDLATLDPATAAEWHPKRNGRWFPTEVSVSSKKRAWWQCPEGHEWQTTIVCRTGGAGCPQCARTGFSQCRPALVYLMLHESERLVKVGICNVGSRRIEQFRSLGWNAVDFMHFSTGREARQVEHLVVGELRGRSAESNALATRRERAARYRQGTTEMFDIDSVPERRLTELISTETPVGSGEASSSGAHGRHVPDRFSATSSEPPQGLML